MDPRKRPFLSSLILCEQRPGSITYLKVCNPPNFNFSNELGIIINNAFPPIKPESNTVYAFTTQRFYCYNLVIVLPDILYSIIMLTKLKLPNVYFSFLQELNTTFTLIGNDSFDPLPLFDYTYSLLCSWKWVSQSKFFAQYPDEAYYIEVDNDAYSLSSFDPLSYFQGPDSIKDVWRAVITGAGLHIICEDPETLSYATFAAQAIISPLIFKDQILITFNPEDERFKDIDIYSIVATTPNVDLTSVRNFKYTVEARKTGVNLSSSSSKKLREDIRAKTKRVVEINVFMMDRMLRKNPFNDLLEGPYMTDDADPLFEPKKNKKMPLLLPDEYRMVETTETFRHYRRKIMYRNTFRQYFLSIKPEEALSQQSLQHLKVLEAKFKELENIFANDIHFVSVLRVHMAITKKHLSKFSSSSTSSPNKPTNTPNKTANTPNKSANTPNKPNNTPNKSANPESNAKQSKKVNFPNAANNRNSNNNPTTNSDGNTDLNSNSNPNNANTTTDTQNFDTNNSQLKASLNNPLHRQVSDPKSENSENLDANNPELKDKSSEENLYLFRMNDDDISLSCNFIDQGNDVSYDQDEKIRTLSDPNIQPEVASS